MSADLAVAFGSDWYTRIDPNTGRQRRQMGRDRRAADRSRGRS